MTNTTDIEIIEPTTQTPLALGLQKAEIDQQISTARQYPRTLSRVQKSILDMATLDEESAQECMYALPRGGRPIKGPSIRFAEILKQSFGNCRVAARVVNVDRSEMFVEAEGIFHDLETNSATSARVRRRISDRNGKVFNDDMITITGNAACSIAMRNAILAGVPKPLWRKAYEAVERTIAGDITTLSENRAKAIAALAVFGVTDEQVCEALGKEGIEDISLGDIATLRGMYSAIKNGEETVETVFNISVKGRGSQKANLKELAAGNKDASREGFTAAQNTMNEDIAAAKARAGYASDEAQEDYIADTPSKGADAIWARLDNETLKALDEDSKAILKSLLDDLAKVSNIKAAKNALTGHQKSIRAIGEQSFSELCQAAVSVRCEQLEGGR